jgi:hypothetical protein
VIVFFETRWEDFLLAGRQVGRKRSTKERGKSVSDEAMDRADDKDVEAHSMDAMDAMDQRDQRDAKDEEGDDVQAHSFDQMDAMDSMDQKD